MVLNSHLYEHDTYSMTLKNTYSDKKDVMLFKGTFLAIHSEILYINIKVLSLKNNDKIPIHEMYFLKYITHSAV